MALAPLLPLSQWTWPALVQQARDAVPVQVGARAAWGLETLEQASRRPVQIGDPLDRALDEQALFGPAPPVPPTERGQQELALLAALAAGEDPWAWSPQTPGLALALALSGGLHVFAAAMAAHPSAAQHWCDPLPTLPRELLSKSCCPRNRSIRMEMTMGSWLDVALGFGHPGVAATIIRHWMRVVDQVPCLLPELNVFRFSHEPQTVPALMALTAGPSYWAHHQRLALARSVKESEGQRQPWISPAMQAAKDYDWQGWSLQDLAVVNELVESAFEPQEQWERLSPALAERAIPALPYQPPGWTWGRLLPGLYWCHALCNRGAPLDPLLQEEVPCQRTPAPWDAAFWRPLECFQAPVDRWEPGWWEDARLKEAFLALQVVARHLKANPLGGDALVVWRAWHSKLLEQIERALPPEQAWPVVHAWSAHVEGIVWPPSRLRHWEAQWANPALPTAALAAQWEAFWAFQPTGALAKDDFGKQLMALRARLGHPHPVPEPRIDQDRWRQACALAQLSAFGEGLWERWQARLAQQRLALVIPAPATLTNRPRL